MYFNWARTKGGIYQKLIKPKPNSQRSDEGPPTTEPNKHPSQGPGVRLARVSYPWKLVPKEMAIMRGIDNIYRKKNILLRRMVEFEKNTNRRIELWSIRKDEGRVRCKEQQNSAKSTTSNGKGSSISGKMHWKKKNISVAKSNAGASGSSTVTNDVSKIDWGRVGKIVEFQGDEARNKKNTWGAFFGTWRSDWTLFHPPGKKMGRSNYVWGNANYNCSAFCMSPKLFEPLLAPQLRIRSRNS